MRTGGCTLREKSVKGQLEGTIPSTTEGQNADKSSLIDASGLNTSDMGSMGGNGGFGGGAFGSSDKGESSDSSKNETSGTRKTANSNISVEAVQLGKKSFDPENMPSDLKPEDKQKDADTAQPTAEEPAESAAQDDDTQNKPADEKIDDSNTQNNEQAGRPTTCHFILS